MHVLVDESLPVELAGDLLAVDAETVRERGWTGLRNGALLRAAVEAGFDIIITADASLPSQQNLRRLGIAVVLIVGVRNRHRDLFPLIPDIITAIRLARPGDALIVRPPRPDRIADTPFHLVTYGAGGRFTRTGATQFCELVEVCEVQKYG